MPTPDGAIRRGFRLLSGLKLTSPGGIGPHARPGLADAVQGKRGRAGFQD